MARFGMVINLQKCVGCGCCTFACKAENNTRTRAKGQSHNWADLAMKTEGTFPNTKHWVMCLFGLLRTIQQRVRKSRARHEANTTRGGIRSQTDKHVG